MKSLRIVLCAEGARPDMGGLGLVAVPHIARALADLGHQVVMEIYGPVIPGAEDFTTTDPGRAFQDSLVAVTYPAHWRYEFAPLAVLPTLAHIARADFVMLHSLYSFAVLTGYAAACVHHKKYGLWPHGVLAPFQRSVGRSKKIFYDALFADRILHNASVLFYSAVGERDEAATLGVLAPSVIIPHGIELESFARLPARGAFRQKYLNEFDGPLAIYLGRLNAKKGLDLLVQAMREAHVKNPALRLAIVGAGDPPEFGAQVQAWVREAKLQDVIVMTGLLMGDDKLRVLADADFFVLPSIAENFSFALFEAMASRLPVVISDTLNFAPQVQRAGAGRVVARNAPAIASALYELSVNPTARHEMGERGAQLAANYSWGAVGLHMERAVRALLENEPLPRDLVLGTTFA